MTWSNFQTRIPGKWVLAGEHSVLTGATAVAMPHPDFSLGLSFKPDSSGKLSILPEDAHSVINDLLTALEDNRSADGLVFPKPSGLLRIESTIPVGAGLGSSAALCVALTRWLSAPLGVQESEQFEFSRQLEHRFHGRSSGMDVAVAGSREAISFSMERGPRGLGIKRLPKFTFHDTRMRMRTSDCVTKVEMFREDSRILAMKTDEAMAAASRWAMEGLARFDSGSDKEGLRMIAQAMNQAQECFYAWQLVPGEVKRQIEDLQAKGALGVKITGAGGGGFLVALWE